MAFVEAMGKVRTMGEYQGWTNYATWAACLWIESSEESYHYWQTATGRALGDAYGDPDGAAGILAASLREALNDGAPDHGGTLWGDLLVWALETCDCRQIAAAWVSDYNGG